MWASAAVLISSVAAAVQLFLSPAPWHQLAASVLGCSLVVMAAVSVTAIVVENSRLGYWLSVFTLLTQAVVAIRHPINLIWWVATALLGVAAVLVSDPRLGGWVRGRTTATPVPFLAVLLALILLAAPTLVALVNQGQHPGALLLLTACCWILLLIYVRRHRGAVALVRTLTFGLAGGAAALSGVGRWVWLGLMLSAAAISVTTPVRLAVRPLIERGTRLMIPPELAPEEIQRAIRDQRSEIRGQN